MPITGAIQPSSWLQQLSQTTRTSIDANQDGQIDSNEFVGYLTRLVEAVKDAPASTYATSPVAASTGAPLQRLDAGTAGTTASAAGVAATSAETSAPAVTGWKSFVFGKSQSGNYAGVMVAPSREIPQGYKVGAFRHQLEGFNPDKFDPAHPEGMTLKMIAGRIFEQFDVYSPTAIDDVVAAFNEAGIPAMRNGIDQIDFGNGEGPIDVVRNAAWLDGDKSAGMAWQWAPVDDTKSPMNFTMGVAAPTFLAGGTAPAPGVTTGTPGVSASPGAGATSPTTGVTTPSPTTGVTYPGIIDQIDLSKVNWLHADASTWKVTSQLTGVSIGKDSITLDHSKAGKWPVYNFNGTAVEGNPWVFVNRGGTWYAATYEWLRPGQTEKGVTGADIGKNIKVEPLASWQPQPGERVGFMVSTIARNGDRTSNERTNVVMATWPA